MPSVRWETLSEARDAALQRCLCVPRTMKQIWDENGFDPAGWSSDFNCPVRLDTYATRLVDFYLPDKNRPRRMTFKDALDWTLAHARSDGYDLSNSTGKQLWIDQVVLDTANGCLEITPRWLNDVYEYEDEVPYLTWVTVPAYTDFFPKPALFCDVALAFFRLEMPDRESLTFDFDGREMLWPTVSKISDELEFAHSPSMKLRFESAPRRDIGEVDGTDDEWFSQDEHDRFLSSPVWDKPYRYEDDWTKHKAGLKLIQFRSEEDAEAAHLEFHKRCVESGVQLYAKASGACGMVRRLSKDEGAAWLASVEAKNLAIAKASPLWRG